MQTAKTTNQNPKALTLGAMVEGLYQQGSAVAANGALAVDLATRRLERLLARGGNVRLVAALAELAQELAPVSSSARRQSKGERLLFARAA